MYPVVLVKNPASVPKLGVAYEDGRVETRRISQSNSEDVLDFVAQVVQLPVVLFPKVSFRSESYSPPSVLSDHCFQRSGFGASEVKMKSTSLHFSSLIFQIHREVSTGKMGFWASEGKRK